jgi:hypothetical protein
VEKEKSVRDRIVLGLHSNATRKEIFAADRPISLEKVISICRRAEATKHYMDSYIQDSLSVKEVAVVQSSKTPVDVDSTDVMAIKSSKKTRPSYSRTDTGMKKFTNCKFCKGSHFAGKCPAKDKKCFVCNCRGHFAICCPNSESINSVVQNSTVHENIVVDSDCIENVTYTVGTPAAQNCKEWFINIMCNGQMVKFKVDTGSVCNILPERVFYNIGGVRSSIAHTTTSLTSYSGHALCVLGTVSLEMEHNYKQYTMEFVIVKDAPCSILSLPSCSELSLVSVVHAVSNVIAKEYSDIFEGMGTLPSGYSIQLKEDCNPVVQNARRVPFRLRDKLLQTLEHMESNGTICKVKVATDWVHPIVTVLKPNGDLRVCLDPSILNKNIKREHFAISTPSEIFSKLSQSTVFSTVDATSIFLQLLLDDKSSFLTTFATPFGRYRFLRLPFGISSAPEVFHRTVSEYFKDIKGVEVYIDDLLIHGVDKEEHDTRLRAVLERCRKINLKLNLSKCRFECTSIKYLGHVLGQGVLKADPDKVRAIVDMPKPEGKESLRRLLGMATYLSKFCPNLSNIAAPLRELTKKEAEWTWGNEHDESLRNLKNQIVKTPSLKLFDPSVPVTLSVDASQHGLGAVVLQRGQPVEFASSALTPTQQRYSQLEKEFLAVQFGLVRFHQYVYGQHVTVETDHRPLLGLLRKGLNELSPRLLRIRLRNQYYDYSLVYKPGKSLVLADTLSRAYLSQSCPEALATDRLDFEQVHSVVHGIIGTESCREKLVSQTATDPVMQVLVSYIEKGWPAKKSVCQFSQAVLEL